MVHLPHAASGDPRVWFITGVSGGLGRALAKEAIHSGDIVAGTLRNSEQVDSFSREFGNRAHAVLMDVTRPDKVQQAVDQAERLYGRIDVVVNNAGYGLVGAVEEASMQEVREVFEVNVFGALAVTQAVLPLLRRQRSGHILQISSGAGIKATAGFGIYNATKFALEGFSEALADEVRPLGIRLTIVEPGPFRTNFAGGSMRQAAKLTDDYEPTAGAFRTRMRQIHGHQEGDPAKAARAIVRMVHSGQAPLRLPLGTAVLNAIDAKTAMLQKDADDWRSTAMETAFAP